MVLILMASQELYNFKPYIFLFQSLCSGYVVERYEHRYGLYGSYITESLATWKTS